MVSNKSIGKQANKQNRQIIKIIIKKRQSNSYPNLDMTSSPNNNRRESTHRNNYTHQHNRISSRFESISQRSPVINSPRLNEESSQNDHNYNLDLKNLHLNTELKTKLEIVLKHNSQLLNENATLSQMVNSLRMQIDLTRKQTEAKTVQNASEMSRIMDDFKQQQNIHEEELTKLLDQIAKLHQDNLEFESQKNKQIRLIKQSNERELALHINHIKRSSDDNKDLLSVQVDKLKETVQLREFQIQALKTQTKCEISRLKSENKGLQTEISHLRKLKQVEIKEIVSENRETLKYHLSQFEREKQIQIIKRQAGMKKLKKQLNHKNMEIQEARKEGATQTEDLYDELTSTKNEKLHILQELHEVKQSSQEKLLRQKDRLTSMAQMQRQNMNAMISAERALLKQERQKIILLCIEKTQEIKRLYDIINDQKQSFEHEKTQLTSLINNFRERLTSVELSNKEQNELLKIKMAHLHEADIKALESYYQNCTRNLIKENKILTQSHEADRQKLHKSLQQNDELRKNFEIEISKQKAKLQDMKVKFASANVEFKEQITSLGTKMQLTSQTLLRETQQKQKGAEFFQTQKKKFYRMIEEKDKEIIAIQETMSKLKEINDEEITQLHSQVNMLRDSLITKQQDFKNYKANLQTQFERKSLKLIEQSQKQTNPHEEQILAENQALRGTNNELEKNIFKKQKQIDFLLRETKSLQGQVNVRAGIIEQNMLESQAAIEDEKSKVKMIMNQSEVSMKDYYENKLHSKERDIDGLKKQMSEKDYDLRAIIGKYNTLEKKMKQLLEAQDKLSEFEQKVVHLGLDQNLIKNMGELFMKHNNGKAGDISARSASRVTN